MLTELQAPALSLLDRACDRALEVVDPALLAIAAGLIDHVVAGRPAPAPPADERDADVAALVEQVLVDVAATPDELVRRAGRHFPPGALADLVTACYVLEARARLAIVADALWTSEPEPR